MVDSTLHKYRSETKNFVLYQEIETEGARAVSYMNYRDFHWLVLANGHNDTLVLMWNHDEEEVGGRNEWRERKKVKGNKG